MSDIIIEVSQSDKILVEVENENGYDIFLEESNPIEIEVKQGYPGHSIPAGGTEDQVLTKKTDSD